MYANVVYNYKDSSIWYSTWDERGNKTEKVVPFRPYLYIRDNGAHDAISIYEEYLKKIEFKDAGARRRFSETTKKTYFNLPVCQQFLIDTFRGQQETDEFAKNPLRVFFLDIETYSPNGFPNPLKAEDEIIVITVYDSITKHYNVFGNGYQYYAKDDDVIYYYFQDEDKMLRGFVRWWRKHFPDIVSGWYSFGFDLPYICNRLARVYGDEFAASKLSPVGRSWHKEECKKRFGAVERIYDQLWNIDGVTHIDMQAAYYKFSPKKLESYSLNSVCAAEGLGQKLEYDGSLSDWWVNNPREFIDYNIQDVRLLVRLENKLKYMQMCRHMANSALAPLGDSLSTLPIVTGLVALEALKRERVISSFDNSDQIVQFEGGYVSDPRVGFAKSVVSIDASSLYPSCILTLNISNETKVGWVDVVDDDHVLVKTVSGKMKTMTRSQFREFLTKADVAIAPNRVMFTQRTIGVLPSLLKRMFDRRKKIKTEMLNIEKLLSKEEAGEVDLGDKKDFLVARAELLDVRQKTIKVEMNSVYGGCGEKHYALFDVDLSTAITAAGRETIKQTAELVNRRASELFGSDIDVGIYTDTDSVVGNSKIVVDGNEMTISEFYDSIDGGFLVNDSFNENFVKSCFGHVVDCYLNGNVVKRPVKYVMKHKVRKSMYRVTVGDKSVEMTGDHSIMVRRNEAVIPVKPIEAIDGDELVISALKYVKSYKIESIGEKEETVYDIEVEDCHNFFANDILVHNSRYFTIDPILEKRGLKFLDSDGSITKGVYDISEDIAGYVDAEIAKWHKKHWNCKNPAIGFKREALAPAGIFVTKKRYCLWDRDDEGVLCDKFVYHGLEVVRSSTPSAVKPMIRDIIETAIKTQDRSTIVNLAKKYWNDYQKLGTVEKSVAIGCNNMQKFIDAGTRSADGSFVPAKGTPRQVVAGIQFNDLLSSEGLDKKYEKIAEGDKIRIIYVKEPNRFGLRSFAFKKKIPTEWENDLVIDDKTMFLKTVWSGIQKIFDTVGWSEIDPTLDEAVDLDDILGL